MRKNGKVRCYCSSCKQLTWHDIIAKASTSSDDDGFWWNIDYYLVKCCGCDEYTFLTESEDESDVEYDEYGNMTLNTSKKHILFSNQLPKNCPIFGIYFLRS